MFNFGIALMVLAKEASYVTSIAGWNWTVLIILKNNNNNKGYYQIPTKNFVISTKDFL